MLYSFFQVKKVFGGSVFLPFLLVKINTPQYSTAKAKFQLELQIFRNGNCQKFLLTTVWKRSSFLPGASGKMPTPHSWQLPRSTTFPVCCSPFWTAVKVTPLLRTKNKRLLLTSFKVLQQPPEDGKESYFPVLPVKLMEKLTDLPGSM